MRVSRPQVNTTPALNADTPLDVRIKEAMVNDLMHMVGVVPYDREAYEEVRAPRMAACLYDRMAEGLYACPALCLHDRMPV